jgi:hypothetical protein
MLEEAIYESAGAMGLGGLLSLSRLLDDFRIYNYMLRKDDIQTLADTD